MPPFRNLARKLLERVPSPRWTATRREDDARRPTATQPLRTRDPEGPPARVEARDVVPPSATTRVPAAAIVLAPHPDTPGREAELLSERVCALTRVLTEDADGVQDELAHLLQLREATRGLRVFTELYPQATSSGTHLEPIHRALRKIGRFAELSERLQAWRDEARDPALAIVFDLLLDRHEAERPALLARAHARLAKRDRAALRAAVYADLDRVVGPLLRQPVDPDARLEAYVHATLDRALRVELAERAPALRRAAWRLDHATALLEHVAPRSEALRPNVDALHELVSLARAAAKTFDAAASLRADLSPRCTTLEAGLTHVLAHMETLRGEVERETRRVLLPWSVAVTRTPHRHTSDSDGGR